MPPSDMSDPRRATNTTGTRVGRAGRPHDATPTRRRTPDIDDLLWVLGRAYVDGPAICPAGCRRPDRWPPQQPRQALFVQSPMLARCFGCGREFTYWRLWRIVTEDAHLVRLLARELAMIS